MPLDQTAIRLPNASSTVELRAAAITALAVAIAEGRIPARPSPAVSRYIADVLSNGTASASHPTDTA
jgi:hypothetical protein